MPQLSACRSIGRESGGERFDTVPQGATRRSAAAVMRLTYRTRAVRQLTAVRGFPAPELADFAGQKRTQLQVLQDAVVTAFLRVGVEGRTWVASAHAGVGGRSGGDVRR